MLVHASALEKQKSPGEKAYAGSCFSGGRGKVVVMQIWFSDYKWGWSGISRLEYVAKRCSQVSSSDEMLLFLISKGWSLGRAGVPLFGIHSYSCVCFGGWDWWSLGFWVLGNVNRVLEIRQSKARLPVEAGAGPLLHCQHLHVRANCSSHGKWLQSGKIPNPLGPAVSEGYQEGGGSFFTQKGALCFQVLLPNGVTFAWCFSSLGFLGVVPFLHPAVQ